MVALDIPRNLSQIFPKRNQKIELRNFITLNSLNLTVPTVFNCRGNEVAPSQEMNHLSTIDFQGKNFRFTVGGLGHTHLQPSLQDTWAKKPTQVVQVV